MPIMASVPLNPRMNPENAYDEYESPFFRYVIAAFVGAGLLLFLVLSTLRQMGPHTGGSSPKMTCICNLRQIDNAKVNWAIEHHAPSNAVPTWDDIKPYLERGSSGSIPTCPAGGIYSIGAISNFPTCSIKGHALQ
jgi:hypothetical protein